MADTVIKLTLDASGAVQGLDNIEAAAVSTSRTLGDIRKELKSVSQELGGLDSTSDEFAKLAARAGALKDEMKDVAESINANAGPALENVAANAGNLQGQLQNLDFDGAAKSAKGLATSIGGLKFGDLQKGVSNFGNSLKGLGKALLANPIFLLSGILIAVIANFKEISEVLDSLTNRATRDFAKATQQAVDASKAASEAFDLEERRLRALGVAEDEIRGKRLDLLQAEQKAFFNQAQAQSRVVGNLKAEYGDLVNQIGAAGDDARAKVKEAEDQLTAYSNSYKQVTVSILEQQRKETDLQNTEREKQTEKARQELEKQNANAKKATEDRIQTDEELDAIALKERNDAILKAREELESQLALLEARIQSKQLEVAEGSIAVVKQTELEKLVARQNAATEAEKIDKQLRDSEIALASGALGAIQSLTDAFAGQSEQSAKRAFQLNKAASIAQALISTYQGVNAIFASTAANPSTVLNPAFPFIQAGIAVAAGLANVAKIAKTKFGDTGGGGGGGPRPSSGGGGSSAPASGFAQFDQSQINNRPNQPTPAYVLASDVKTQTEAQQKVEDRARL